MLQDSLRQSLRAQMERAHGLHRRDLADTGDSLAEFWYRHHLHESVVQLAVKASGLAKRATCHSFRHSFCSRMAKTSILFRSCSATRMWGR